jgi:hypothetical protein
MAIKKKSNDMNSKKFWEKIKKQVISVGSRIIKYNWIIIARGNGSFRAKLDA